MKDYYFDGDKQEVRQKNDYTIYFESKEERWQHVEFQCFLFNLGEMYGKNKDRKSLKKLFRVLKDSKSKLHKMLYRDLNKRAVKMSSRITKKAIMDSYKEGFKARR